MRIYIVVEDRSGAELLKRLSRAARSPGVEIMEARGGPSAALALARSLRAGRGAPVLLVIDARSVDPESIAEQRVEIEDLLTSVGPAVPSHVVFAVPALEVVLFHQPEVIEEALGVEMTEREGIEARFIPKTVLSELLRRSPRIHDEMQLVAALDDVAAARLAGHPLIRTVEERIADIRGQYEEALTRLRRTG